MGYGCQLKSGRVQWFRNRDGGLCSCQGHSFRGRREANPALGQSE